MHWNNRVVRVDDGATLMLREVYYNENSEPIGHADICAVGDDLAELRRLTARLAAAVDYVINGEAPVLDERDFASCEVQLDLI
jgi:hypothetical protein